MSCRLYTIAKCKHLKVLDFRKVKLKVRPWDSLWPPAAGKHDVQHYRNAAEVVCVGTMEFRDVKTHGVIRMKRRGCSCCRIK